MSDDVVMLDPEAARALAGAMRTAGVAWRREAEALAAIGAGADLAATVQPALEALAEAAGDCDLAAADLDLRADLIEAIDEGDGAAAGRLSVTATASITRWEAAISGGVDETVVTTTATTGEDLLDRFGPPAPATVVGPGVACLAASYRRRGTLTGVDGREYDLMTPQVGHVVDGERRSANADWGEPPPGVDVWSLDGADPGWVTVGREQGVGQLDPAARGWDYLLIGPAATAYSTSSGYTPASLAAHADLALDASGVPRHVTGQAGGTLRLPEDVIEIGPQTPVLTASPGGHLRYETTPTTRGAAATGIAQLVGLAAEAGLTARHVRDQGNYAYTVEYQEHPDGRRRAIPVVYALALDGDGEPVAFVGYLAPGADGALQAEPIVPRIHDGYDPPITVNPES